MDHLPAVSEAAVTFPPVPFYESGQMQYVGPFASFRDKLPDHDTTLDAYGQTISTFAQQWLFFGLMQEVFTVYELPFDPADFLQDSDGVHCISTRALNDYMVALVVQEHIRRQSAELRKGTNLMDNDDIAAAGGGYGSTENSAPSRIWEWLRAIHNLLLTTKDALLNDPLLNGHHIDAAVWDSILLTAAALSRITDVLLRPVAPNGDELHYPVDFQAFRLRSIPDLRDNDTWCPNERKVIAELTSGQPQEIAFFSRLDRKEPKNFHAECAANECIAHNVKEGYQTAHNLTEEHPVVCKMIEHTPTFEPPPPPPTEFKVPGPSKIGDTVQGIYQGLEDMYLETTKEVDAVVFKDGEIQSVRVPLAKSKISARFGVPISGWNLVAVSHVWSDKLGNKTANALPACQLERIQGLVNGLFHERHHPVPFWIDTLMIPIVAENLTGDELIKAKEGKIRALRNMEWVYKGASKVLVLDSSLFNLDSEGLQSEELGARIMLSTWSRRLWTLQEGCIEDRTLFQFKDRTLSWPSLHKDLLQRTSATEWRDKHSTLPKKHPIRNKQKIPSWKYNGSSTQWDLGNPLNSRTKVDISSPRRQAKLVLDKMLFKAINPVWYTVHSFLEDMSIEWSGDGPRGEALSRCMRSMWYRTCTNKTDEGLVLSSLLSAKPGSAAAIFSTSKKEDRVRDLFLELDVLPVNLLFVNQERYEEDHRRWIPKSLLSANASDAHLLRRSERLHRRTTLVRRKLNVVCKRVETGLEIGLDGLRVHPQPCTLVAPFRFQHNGAYYRVDLSQPGTGKAITEREEESWVLIPEAVFATQPAQCQAVLVKVRTWYRRRPGAETEFSALAVVTKMSDGEWSESAVPVLALKLFEKTKKTSWNALKDIVNTVQTAASEFVHSDDKWTVG